MSRIQLLQTAERRGLSGQNERDPNGALGGTDRLRGSRIADHVCLALDVGCAPVLFTIIALLVAVAVLWVPRGTGVAIVGVATLLGIALAHWKLQLYRHSISLPGEEIAHAVVFSLVGAIVFAVTLIQVPRAAWLSAPFFWFAAGKVANLIERRRSVRDTVEADRPIAVKELELQVGDFAYIEDVEDLGSLWLFDVSMPDLLVLRLDCEEEPEEFPTERIIIRVREDQSELESIECFGEVVSPAIVLPSSLFRQIRFVGVIGRLTANLSECQENLEKIRPW